MINIKPNFFSEFSCIADKCTDSCCIGWEIDIDENALTKYKDKKDFQKNISLEDTPHFILKENDRCPFLNEKNLCNMILNCGEDYLCDICREHPRFYEWYGNFKDCGLGLCCEEACRLLFNSNEPLSFIEEIDSTVDDNEIDEGTAQRIYETRKAIFKILADRQDLSLAKRIEKCCDYISSLQKSFACKHTAEVKDTANEIFEIMKMSEPFDDIFTEFLNKFSFDDLNKKTDKTQLDYERLFSYFVFRHFVKAIYDNDLITHFKVCILLLVIAILYDQTNSEVDKINTTKYISKQFEYSEENIDLLEFECADNHNLSFENLVALTDYLL